MPGPATPGVADAERLASRQEHGGPIGPGADVATLAPAKDGVCDLGSAAADAIVPGHQNEQHGNARRAGRCAALARWVCLREARRVVGAWTTCGCWSARAGSAGRFRARRPAGKAGGFGAGATDPTGYSLGGAGSGGAAATGGRALGGAGIAACSAAEVAAGAGSADAWGALACGGCCGAAARLLSASLGGKTRFTNLPHAIELLGQTTRFFAAFARRLLAAMAFALSASSFAGGGNEAAALGSLGFGPGCSAAAWPDAVERFFVSSLGGEQFFGPYSLLLGLLDKPARLVG